MNKLIIPITIVTLLSASCGDKKTNKTADQTEDSKPTTAIKIEPEESKLETIKDSIVLEIEKAEIEIEESAQKLEAAINQLN